RPGGQCCAFLSVEISEKSAGDLLGGAGRTRPQPILFCAMHQGDQIRAVPCRIQIVTLAVAADGGLKLLRRPLTVESERHELLLVDSAQEPVCLASLPLLA